MIQVITVLHILVCLVLVCVVLLQQGKKDGMGAAFGGGSQSVFGARGAETFLEKFTKILAVLFMCTSLGLVYLSSKESTGSLLSTESTKAPLPATAPEAKTTDGTPTTAPGSPPPAGVPPVVETSKPGNVPAAGQTPAPASSATPGATPPAGKAPKPATK